MASYGVSKAKTHFSRLVREAAKGDDVIITRNGQPVAQLVPLSGAGRRQLGRDLGRFDVPEDFDAPLPPNAVTGFAT